MQTGHMPQLDGLRALAVMGVIVHHTMPYRYRPGLPLGTASVWIFYCLSGYLITGILAAARDRAEATGASLGGVWRAFWVRRALRIFPLYYAALAALAVMGVEAVRQEWPWSAAYLMNLRLAWLGRFPAATSHFWSLSVEEQFYLLWPPVCLFVPRRHLARVAAGCVVAAPLIRFAIYKATWDPIAAAFLTPCCLDGLAIGAVLALTRWTPPR
jgi:peptidoglycan/LPS O-acetylase OafA/YrhL